MHSNQNKQIDWKIIMTGLICITIIELYALHQGINGVLLTIVIGIIAAACGVAIPKDKFIK